MEEATKKSLLELFDVLVPVRNESYLRRQILFTAVDLLKEVDTAKRKGQAVKEVEVTLRLSKILIDLIRWTKAVIGELSPNFETESFKWFVDSLLSDVIEDPDKAEMTSIFFEEWEEDLEEVIRKVLSNKGVRDVWEAFLSGFDGRLPRLLHVVKFALEINTTEEGRVP